MRYSIIDFGGAGGGATPSERRLAAAGIEPEQAIQRFKRRSLLQRAREAMERVAYAEPRATAYAFEKAGEAWKRMREPAQGFAESISTIGQATPPGMAVNWWRAFGSTLARGKKSVAAGMAPSERISATRWAKEHPWKAGAAGLAADIGVSPSTVLTLGVGATKAAGQAGLKVLGEILPTLLKDVPKGRWPTLGKAAAHVAEVAGREGYVSPRLVTDWIERATPHVGEQGILRRVAEVAAEAGEVAAKGGLRYGVGKYSIPLVPRAAIRRAGAAVTRALEKTPALARTGEAFGKMMRPGYIRATTELLPEERRMVEEAIRQSWRSKAGAMEKVSEDVRAITKRLKPSEAELIPDLIQLPGLPEKGELPNFGRLLGELKEGAEGTDIERLSLLHQRFTALSPERQKKIQYAARGVRAWFEEQWAKGVGPRQEEILRQAAELPTLEGMAARLGIAGRKLTPSAGKKVAAWTKGIEAAETAGLTAARHLGISEPTHPPATIRWAEQTLVTSLKTVDRLRRQIGRAQEKAGISGLPENRLAIYRALTTFGESLAGGGKPAERALGWLRGEGAGPPVADRLKELAEHIVAQARPGYRESYVPGMTAGGFGRLPLRAAGPAREAFEKPKVFGTLWEREAASASVADRLKALQVQHGGLMDAWTKGEGKASISMQFGKKIVQKEMPIENAIQEVADKFYELAPVGARLPAEKDIRLLMLNRGVRGSTVAARRELLGQIKDKIAVPKSQAPQRPGWVETAYEELKGYLIPKEVAGDMERHLNVLMNPEKIGGGILGQAYASWMRLWRWSLTAGRPAWALMTNPQGNIYNGVVLASMEPRNIWRNFVDGIRLLRYVGDDAGKFYSEAAEKLGEGGVFKRAKPVFAIADKQMPAQEVMEAFMREGGMASFGRTEVPGLHELPILKQAAPAIQRAQVAMERPAEILGALTPRAIANYTERASKAALFLDGLRKGMTVEDAGARMRKYLFAYGELTPAERNIRNFLVPFYVWTKNNTGLQLEMFARKPGLQLATVRARAIAQNNLSPVPQEELPSWVGESSYIPFGGTRQRVKLISQYLPLYDLTRLGDLKSIMSNFYPFTTVPTSLVLGREFGTGKELSPGTMVRFPLPVEKAIPPFLREAFGIELGIDPPGSGKKAWVWPAKTNYIFGQVLPYLTYSGRYMQEPIPRKQVQRLQQFIIGMSVREMTAEEMQRSKQGQRRAATAAAMRHYRALGKLPATKRAQERWKETQREMLPPEEAE